MTFGSLTTNPLSEAMKQITSAAYDGATFYKPPFKERPILFSTPMVQAILHGDKTVTRRVLKVQPKGDQKFIYKDGRIWVTLANGEYDPTTKKTIYGGEVMLGGDCLFYSPIVIGHGPNGAGNPMVCPYGKPGDFLWVRESFSAWFGGRHWYEVDREDRVLGKLSNLFFRATHRYPDDDQKWIPSIFMPRWASRLILQLADVSLSWLHDMTEPEAELEGYHREGCGGEGNVRTFNRMWDILNSKRGYGYETNPLVWRLEYKVNARK